MHLSPPVGCARVFPPAGGVVFAGLFEEFSMKRYVSGLIAAGLAVTALMSNAFGPVVLSAQVSVNNCQDVPTAAQLREWLQAAPKAPGAVGGLFSGTRMWAAVVNRTGEVCA